MYILFCIINYYFYIVAFNSSYVFVPKVKDLVEGICSQLHIEHSVSR